MPINPVDPNKENIDLQIQQSSKPEYNSCGSVNFFNVCRSNFNNLLNAESKRIVLDHKVNVGLSVAAPSQSNVYQHQIILPLLANCRFNVLIRIVVTLLN